MADTDPVQEALTLRRGGFLTGAPLSIPDVLTLATYPAGLLAALRSVARVFRRVLVSSRAMSRQSHSPRAPLILAARDHLKMGWTHARRRSTDMVKFKTFRNGPFVHVVDGPMRQPRFSSVVGSAVSTEILAPLPQPTAAHGIDQDVLLDSFRFRQPRKWPAIPSSSDMVVVVAQSARNLSVRTSLNDALHTSNYRRREAQMGDETEAQRALTVHELDSAVKLGLEVTTCRVCKRPTLWMKGTWMVHPLTCGRSVCLDVYAEDFKK